MCKVRDVKKDSNIHLRVGFSKFLEKDNKRFCHLKIWKIIATDFSIFSIDNNDIFVTY